MFQFSIMKNSIYILLILLTILACNSTKPLVSGIEKHVVAKNDTIRIANDSLEYEVIIIDSGFSSWLVSRSYPRNYHSQSFLENKNRLYVSEWNSRAMQTMSYDTNLYGMTINYDSNINYGYEVNYLIYNYMIYFQNTFNQKLFGNVPSR